MSGRLAYVDALRGFAILGVIIAHAGSIAGLEGRIRMLSGFAGMGVQLFFVISAFTIFLTFARASSSESRPVGNFLRRKICVKEPDLPVTVFASINQPRQTGACHGVDHRHIGMVEDINR
ncbi:acyltransferase family protein [Mesorhizobium sp. M0859]|uniref:acyltransferase family protein n=1 Tax=Mesorhizobium sp. M0859 TaxID=2957014 RepID=UPI00333CE280